MSILKPSIIRRTFYRSGKLLILGYFLILSTSFLKGQNNYGVSTSNYATIEGGVNNPARLANRMVDWEISVLNFNYFQLNNYFVYKGIFESLGSDNAFDLSSLLTTQQGLIRNRSSDLRLPIQSSNSTELRYLSGLYTFGKTKKMAVGLSFATKSLFNIQNMNTNFFSLYDRIKYQNEPLVENQLANFTYNFNNASILHNIYSEIKADFASEIINDEKKRFTLGISIKRNIGIYYNYLKAKNLFLRFEPNKSGTGQDISAVGDLQYSYSRTDNNVKNFDFFPTDNLFNISTGSGGWATDIGVEFEFKMPKSKKKESPEKNMIPKKQDIRINDTSEAIKYPEYATYNDNFDIINLYKSQTDSVVTDCKKNYYLKLAFHLNNLGYVRYRNKKNIRSLSTKTDQVLALTEWANAMNNISTPDNLYNYFLTQLPTSTLSAFEQTIYLPATATFSADIKVPSNSWPFNKSYVNMGYNQNLMRFTSFFSNVAFSHAFIVPRYETKNFDISFPVTIYTEAIPQFPLIKFGVGARYKYFYVSTESFGTIFSKPATQMLSFSVGFKYTMFENCSNPKDLTKLGDILDSTKQEEWIDTDGDGIFDNEDKCIDIPGDTSNNGCPIIDSLATEKSEKASQEVNFITADERPIVLDDLSLNIDSLFDYLKKHQNTDILVSAYGDNNMTSPEEKVKLAQQRAENTTHELIKKGLAPNRVKNSIGLGFLQPHGTVDVIRVYEENRDEDFDGILDSIDRCPTLPGLLSHDGCPEYKTNEQLLLEEISEGITFKAKTSTLTYDSKQSIDRLKEFMISKPNISLTMYGPSDTSVLDRNELNQLSDDRAEYLNNLLIQNNIPEDKLHFIGISHLQPVNSYSILNEYDPTSDKDKDGTKDHKDKCPTIPGSPWKNGCPFFEDEEILTTLNTISKNIKFNPGTADFTSDSKQYLKDLKNYFKKYPDVFLLINENAKEEFLTPHQQDKLAQLRSDKIKEYLLDKGIKNAQITSNGLSHLETEDAIEKLRLLDPNSDIDEDGIYDFEDKCPTIPGSPRQNGCPIGNDEDIIKKFNAKFYFLENSDKLPQESIDAAKDLTNYLLNNPQTKIVAYGSLHDPYASPNSKSMISRQRAARLGELLRNNGVPSNQFYNLDLDPSEDVRNIPIISKIGNNEDPDGDGVSIKYDKCPTTFGLEKNSGCPDGSYITSTQPKDLDDEFKLINKNLQFSQNSPLLSRTGKDAYDKFLEYLNRYPNKKFVIYSKYDQNQTQPEDMEQLSKARADFLQTLLELDGINNNRVKTIGIGAKQPLNVIDNIKTLWKENSDFDKDDVFDKNDKCPTVPGRQEYYGCPSSSTEQQALQNIARNIYFRLNSSQINPSSYRILDAFIDYLKKETQILTNSNTQLFIYGRTDNTGGYQYNKNLSARRAKSIYDYMIMRGIPKDRIFPIGIGQDFPVATNSTLEGRRKNRIVEFDLKRF